jgi:hypothetical protein
MQKQYLKRQEGPQVPPYDATQMAQGLTEALAQFLWPLLVCLDAVLDKREVAHLCANKRRDAHVS